MVLNFSHPQTVHSPGRLWMGGRRAGNSTAGVPGYPSRKTTGFFLCEILWVSKEQNNLCGQVKNLLWKFSRTLDWAVPYKPAYITCSSRHRVQEEYPTFENLGRTLPLSLYFSITQHTFKSSTAALPDLKMQVFSKSHEYLPVLYSGSARTLQMTMGTCIS